jgi:sporulation protein YlmC with PRC-barrel domain
MPKEPVMRTCKRIPALIASAIVLPSIALAQTNPPPGGTTPTGTTATTPRTSTHRPWNEPASRWQKGSDVIGKDVQTASGEDIGDVEDVIVDVDSGRVLYMIVSCEGRSCAIPPSALTLPADAKKFTVSFSKEQLKTYSFDKKSYPNFGDRDWAGQIHSHYGQTPYWERAGMPADDKHPWYRFTTHWYKGSDLIGMNVKNPQNEDLGKIEDLVLDPDGGRVIYAVLSFGGFLGMGDKLFAVPMSSLDPSADNKFLTFNVDKDRLKNASGFDKKNWPNMADQRWATETHTFYNQRPYWEDPAGTGQSNVGRTEPTDVSRTDQSKGAVWVCKSHPSTRQNQPGKCSICQAELTRDETRP